MSDVIQNCVIPCSYWDNIAEACMKPDTNSVDKDAIIEKLQNDIQDLLKSNDIMQQIVVKMCYEKYMGDK